MTPARLAAAALVALATPAAAAPSFDCGKAASPVEKAICADAGLAELDARLAGLYRDALAAAAEPAKAALRDGQRAWVDRRDGCADGAEPVRCIEAAYRQRIAALEADAAPLPAWVGEALAAPAGVARCIDAVPSLDVALTDAAAESGRLRLALATPTGRTYDCTVSRDGEGMASVHDGEAAAEGPALRWGEAAPSGCATARPVLAYGAVRGWLLPAGC